MGAEDPPELDPRIQKSIEQGVEYLEKNNDEIELRLSGGRWNFASGDNSAGKQLIDEIDAGAGHSGGSFGTAVRSIVQRAKDALGYSMTEKEVPSNVPGLKDRIITLRKVRH